MVSETLAVRGPVPVATIFKLIIEDDEGKTTVYPLADGDISIGRKDGNTIRLMERNVSRRHARLLRTNGAVYIEDLDSYNGIRINGERISGRYEVKEGDLVEIGDYHLALQRQEIEDAATDDMTPQKPEGWPAVGTVPDFRLPDEILAENATVDPQVSTRDTIVDQPAPAELPAAIAHTVSVPDGHNSHGGHKEPAKHHTPQLPPFPTPGAPPPSRVPFFSGAAAPIVKPGDDEPTKSLSVGPSRVAAVPRLICVSTTYSGREFALTRPELIIGRVEDNDIVIEHRSVSRNHAKILYDGRTHKIIDLQSANGILVNGEEYAMTDLRKGDLIELGHVRFRFVPAGDEFAPTDEEAREMREAGVEPPAPPGREAAMKAVEMPSEVGAYDPSTAQTVTDTPLSALTVNEAFAPKIEVTKPNPGRRRPDSHAPKNGAAPKRATEDERPTEVNHVSSRAQAQSSAPTAPMMGAVAVSAADPMDAEFTKPQAVSVVEEMPRASKSKPMVPILGGVVVLGVVAAVAAFMLNGTTEGADAHLKSLYENGQFQAADAFCKSLPDFDDPLQAGVLCGKAELELQKKPRSDVVPDDTEPHDMPVGEVEEIEGEGEGEGEEVVDDATLAAKGTTQVVRRQPKRIDPSLVKAKDLFLKGTKALLAGRLSNARDALTECVDASPNFADCHRQLGVLYAQLDDTGNSVKHYKRYIQLKPNAPDAGRVRKLIRDVEEGGGTPP